MVSLSFVFWLILFIAGVVGGMRGWAKELLVIFSVILSLFIIGVMETYIGFFQAFLINGGLITQFWTRILIILVLAFFGYETPHLKQFRGGARKEKVQDAILGILLGALNGYLIWGSIWWYLHQAGYPYAFALPPVAGTPLGESAFRLINMLPPKWLGIPGIYFAVAIAFTFIVIVFV